MKDPYLGLLVVRRIIWNIRSDHFGVIVELMEKDRVLVLWTTKKGFELKVHSKDALMPVNDTTIQKIRNRNCVFK